MPRNTSGVYTLPAGNPVTTRTIIESSWANNTLSDIATEITESLARNGAGGMTGPMKATDGTAAAPSITFGSETSTGLYRVASGQLGITTGGVQRFNISSSGSTFSVPVTVNGNLTVSGTISGNGSSITSLNASNITSGTLADAYLSSNVPLKNVTNTFTGGIIVNAVSNSGITVQASTTAQVRFECTGAATNNKNWIAYADSASWRVLAYTDDYSSGTTAMSVARSGITPGAISTYSSVNVGDIQAGSIGRLNLVVGDATHTGYIEFRNVSGGREGYIGFSTTAGGNDTGNIPYVAGIHAFTGNISVGGVSSGTALTVNGVPTQYAASFNGGTVGSGSLSGIYVYGSTNGYIVSSFRNTHASGFAAIEVHGANGASSSFIAAHPTKAVFGSNTNTQVEIWTNNQPRVSVTENGNVYVSAPVSGTALYVYGNIYATGTITQGSDARLKTNVQTIDSALDKVSAMRGVSFTHKDTGQRDVGVIAQEVAEVVPEVVREDENGYLSVAYGNMVGVLIEAVKELRDEVWQLKAECCH
jgi:uncharacterized protein YaiE (UPF0345 family)